jgi:hypothetical protein
VESRIGSLMKYSSKQSVPANSILDKGQQLQRPRARKAFGMFGNRKETAMDELW